MFYLKLPQVTIILQKDFLQYLENTFIKNPTADALLPRGRGSYTLWPEKYDFHDPHFPTSRCTAYRHAVLKELGGFMSSFAGLRKRYSTLFLWLVAFNCSRHTPLLFSPIRCHREMGRFGLGFILGFVKAWVKPETHGTYG